MEGKRLVRRFLRNLARIPLLFFLLVLSVMLGDDGKDVGGAFSSLVRKGDVHGTAPDCSALACADAANTARRHVWLVWSDTRIALVRATKATTPHKLWSAEGGDRPRLKTYTVRWRDGSCIELPVGRRERQRFHQYKGEQ